MTIMVVSHGEGVGGGDGYEVGSCCCERHDTNSQYIQTEMVLIEHMYFLFWSLLAQ